MDRKKIIIAVAVAVVALVLVGLFIYLNPGDAKLCTNFCYISNVLKLAFMAYIGIMLGGDIARGWQGINNFARKWAVPLLLVVVLSIRKNLTVPWFASLLGLSIIFTYPIIFFAIMFAVGFLIEKILIMRHGRIRE